MAISSSVKHGDPIADIKQSPFPGSDLQAFATRQFQEFLDDLQSSFDEQNAVAEIDIRPDALSLALIQAMQQQIGSGNFLTSDETGFTVDSDRLSVDMDEA